MLVEASHIVGQSAKNIKYYKLKQAVDHQSLQEKKLYKRSKWKQHLKSLIRNTMILLQVKKHYKISSTIHLMKELMIS